MPHGESKYLCGSATWSVTQTDSIRVGLVPLFVHCIVYHTMTEWDHFIGKTPDSITAQPTTYIT